MKLTVSKSKNSASFYVQKSIRKPDGSVTTITIEKLGNLDEVKTRAQGMDPYKWAQEYHHPVLPFKTPQRERTEALQLRLSVPAVRLLFARPQGDLCLDNGQVRLPIRPERHPFTARFYKDPLSGIKAFFK